MFCSQINRIFHKLMKVILFDKLCDSTWQMLRFIFKHFCKNFAKDTDLIVTLTKKYYGTWSFTEISIPTQVVIVSLKSYPTNNSH